MKKQKLKVALYARVSSTRQEKRETIASQVEVLKSHCKKQKYSIVKDFVCLDDGVSGTLLDRAGLDRLRDGAEAGCFDAVLVLSPDRLSRKYAYLILIQEEFERFGVQVLYVEQPLSDDPQSQLLTQIQGAVAEYERIKTQERYRRGKLHRARQGEVCWSSVPYGYRRIPRKDGVAAYLVVDEQQAEAVRQIFHLHGNEELSLRKISRRLTESGRPTPKGNTVWGETTIHRILRREAYIGTTYYNRTQSVAAEKKNLRGPKNNIIIRPKEEWISVAVPSIIDTELFERSQALHLKNRKFSPRRLKEEQWLLRQLIRCGKCDNKLTCVADTRRPHMPPSYYYRCGHYRLREQPHPPRCRPNHLRSEPIDELVWEEIKRHLLDPELLIKAHHQLEHSVPVDQQFLTDQLDKAQKRLSESHSQRLRLLDAYQGGFVDKKEFQQRADRLQERTDVLQKELKGLVDEKQKILQGNSVISRIKDFTKTVSHSLDTTSFQQRQALAKEVIEEVVIDAERVKIFFRIPLPKTQPTTHGELNKTAAIPVSNHSDLRSRRTL